LAHPQLFQSQFKQGEEVSGWLQRAVIEHVAFAILIPFVVNGINREEFRFTLIGGILSCRRLIRVSELANLRIGDIDFIKPSITVRGKGSVEREIALEKKGIHALKSYLAIRPDSISSRVFFNYQGEPISERGIRKLVVKYRKEAGITKKASCHTLRHTFATYKAEKGVSPFQLQQWLGHANLNTTQIYVHLGKQNARKVMQDTSLV
jgi:site-specific recombinase XerC